MVRRTARLDPHQTRRQRSEERQQLRAPIDLATTTAPAAATP
jgi:hypothetical protein